ncbi:hypothetical protein Esti_006764 [Eimeria stiedai]
MAAAQQHQQLLLLLLLSIGGALRGAPEGAPCSEENLLLASPVLTGDAWLPAEAESSQYRELLIPAEEVDVSGPVESPASAAAATAAVAAVAATAAAAATEEAAAGPAIPVSPSKKGKLMYEVRFNLRMRPQSGKSDPNVHQKVEGVVTMVAAKRGPQGASLPSLLSTESESAGTLEGEACMGAPLRPLLRSGVKFAFKICRSLKERLGAGGRVVAVYRKQQQQQQEEQQQQQQQQEGEEEECTTAATAGAGANLILPPEQPSGPLWVVEAPAINSRRGGPNWLLLIHGGPGGGLFVGCGAAAVARQGGCLLGVLICGNKGVF